MNKGETKAERRIRTLSREFVIVNALGLHARPAALFVKTSMRFESDIQVEKDQVVVSGKSIMGLMTLEAGVGAILRVTAVGHDAAEVLNELQHLIESKFFEE